MFVEDLMMTKPQKSVLVQDLETKLTNDDERAPAMDCELQTACIADEMANINEIKTKVYRRLAISVNSFWTISLPLVRGQTGWI